MGGQPVPHYLVIDRHDGNDVGLISTPAYHYMKLQVEFGVFDVNWFQPAGGAGNVDRYRQ